MQKKKGISLIVLVITIIVMIVLAGAIILSLNKAGIIGKANQAVKDTDEATLKEIAQLGWADAYATYGADIAKLKEGVESTLTKNNLKLEDYGMVVTTKGVTIKKGWLQDGFTIVKGDRTLRIGDNIEYNAGVEGYTGAWQVLGADDNGNILIMSTKAVASSRLGYEETMTTDAEKLKESQDDWLSAVSQLDQACASYSNGEGAVGTARSLKVEDVNKVTGYNPDTALYGKGALEQYGNKVAFSYIGRAQKVGYDSDVESGTISVNHENGFYYYNGTDISMVSADDLALAERKGQEITTLTGNYYTYSMEDLDISKVENEKAYKMLFNNNDTTYFLASPFIYTPKNGVYYGIRRIAFGKVSEDDLWSSLGEFSYMSGGVRAVVTLSSELEFTGSSETGWSY